LQALADLPPNLDETYNRILSAIEESDIPYALRILRWLAFSPRPLLLAEVAEIAAIDASRCPAFDRDEVLEDPLEVLSICSSLVTVAASDSVEHYEMYGVLHGPVLLLAHYSVKEYLVSQRILESNAYIYAMESTFCQRSIAKCCLQYLLQFNRLDALTKENVNEFALAKYSAQQWITHSKSNGAQDPELVTLIVKLLDAEGVPYLTWIRLHDRHQPWMGADFRRALPMMNSSLYYASEFGLADVVRWLVSEFDPDVNVQGGYHGNALQAASYLGHLDIVQFLVEKGADFNVQNGNHGNALQAASCSGHLDIVQFLAKKGVDVNAQCGVYGNALQAASWSGHLDVVEFLAEKGADVNVQGGCYGNALQAASASGHLDVVQFLVKKGAVKEFKKVLALGIE
jgi:hypothetical protein